jgi:uncharacterized repeat protein (TIGR03803 family)
MYPDPRSILHWCACTAWIFAAVPAACGQSQLPVNSSGVGSIPDTRSARGVTSGYRLLYAFHARGALPETGLTFVNGSFYGTTFGLFRHDGGTLFALDSQNRLRIVHNFQPGPYGFHPLGGVTELNGTLYGTTVTGGTGSGTGFGVVYSISPSGSNYKVIHTFTGGSDGALPTGNLIVLKGKLYGTTSGTTGYISASCASLAPGCGTVFKITPPDTLGTVYAFKGGADGDVPNGVAAMRNILYGTTLSGGRHQCYGSACGTIFSVRTSGVKQTLYDFRPGKNGYFPEAGLTVLNGTLYGVTAFGGIGSTCPGLAAPPGCGTVFEVSTTGKYMPLHRFTARNGDGSIPVAPLIAVNGTLYGTTEYGGMDASFVGWGTVFSITPRGNETVLHEFQGEPNDGGAPVAPLVDHNGTLYGTSEYGGGSDRGTIFSVTP